MRWSLVWLLMSLPETGHIDSSLMAEARSFLWTFVQIPSVFLVYVVFRVSIRGNLFYSSYEDNVLSFPIARSCISREFLDYFAITGNVMSKHYFLGFLPFFDRSHLFILCQQNIPLQCHEMVINYHCNYFMTMKIIFLKKK